MCVDCFAMMNRVVVYEIFGLGNTWVDEGYMREDSLGYLCSSSRLIRRISVGSDCTNGTLMFVI